VLPYQKEARKVQQNAPNSDNHYVHFGDAMKKRRARLEITQETLAQISGVSLRSIKEMEKGTGNPTLIQLTKVLHVLGWVLELKERGA
jgi:predicted transcriptional regulator